VLAPSSFAGTIEFGKITQASAAFITLRASFSLIGDQFTSLSSVVAVVERLGEYQEASGTGRISPPPTGAVSAATALRRDVPAPAAVHGPGLTPGAAVLPA